MLLGCMMLQVVGCAYMDNTMNNIKGSLVGQSFSLKYYDDYGNNTITMNGTKITISAVDNEIITKDKDGNTSITVQPTSVLDITINGSQTYGVGNTMIALEDGLEMIDGVDIPSTIDKNSGGGFVPFDRNINKIKNKLGTEKIVVISSQQGIPIGVIKGKSVYFEVPTDLPKMTRLVIDGKSCYIHRANYIIMDTNLLV